MKVLHINTYNTGGAAKACLRLHQGLVNKGVESKVLLRNKTNNDVPEVYEIWDNLNYLQKVKKLAEQRKLKKKQLNTLKGKSTVRELFSFPASVWDITQHPLYKWADIIHLHWVAGFVDYTSFFPFCTKKIVWTIHDFEPFSGGFHYEKGLDVTQYKELILQHIAIKQQSFENSLIHVVSPSHYLAKESEKSQLFQSFPHTVIANPVSTVFSYTDQQEAREKLNLPADQKTVLFVADDLNYPRKGFSKLLETIELLKRKSIHFYVIGKGTIAADDNVTAIGPIDKEIDLNLWYAAADLFVIPSLDDNLPNTISESLCCGTPAVGFNVGGITEMIHSDENGILCEDCSVNKLAEGITEGLTMEFDRQRIGKIASKVYGYDTIISAYHELYKK
jgi:glycosyltransferase involved in cell wall biosynthesis